MRQIAVIALFCLGFSMPAWAAGPSFDCAKAASSVEKAICASGDLSALDRQIAEEYRTALSLRRTTVAEERDWLERRDRVCLPDNTTDCLRQLMMERHAFLTGRPKGYKPPTFEGHPSFDCHAAKSRTDVAICGNQRLTELDLALARAYDDAAKIVARAREDQIEWPKVRETLCDPVRPNVKDVLSCLDQEMRREIERLERTVKYWQVNGIVLHGDVEYKTQAIDSEDRKSQWAELISYYQGFRDVGAQVVGCSQLALVSRDRGDHVAVVEGALCTVERAGEKTRTLICGNNLKLSHLPAGDQPIGESDLVEFIISKCDP